MLFPQAADIIKAGNRHESPPESIPSESRFSMLPASSSPSNPMVASLSQPEEIPPPVEVVTVFQTQTVYV